MSTTDTKQATVSYPSDTELVITRTFDAPRELVFAALTQPEHVRAWYGMSEDGLLVCDIDFRVGGAWHYVLGEYLEIDAPTRIVNTERYDNMPGAEYVATVTLDEAAGATTLTNHLRYPSQEMRDGHVSSGMEYGMNISYGRLDTLLAKLAS